VLRLDVPPTLARTLRSTNCNESMISVCRERLPALRAALEREIAEHAAPIMHTNQVSAA
jgi:putative transposase